jgi:hypothetical protein
MKESSAETKVAHWRHGTRVNQGLISGPYATPDELSSQHLHLDRLQAQARKVGEIG